ncbi:DUF3592 domain-containing protein [Zavarzinia compransoris]|uniref:DUF3592 domain-containing protein n=1 Tax=Zavarzinia marina TaxID=2911065 RepID=UPI001F29587C|nr:DUF3592 domain-containing protein [Zavarzinia marina]MCF4166498.1 DUF3592 domain-containing protein [Zavarzinia marina]
MFARGRLTRILIVTIFALAAAWATAAGMRAASDLWRQPDWPAATAEVTDVLRESAADEDGRYRLELRFMAPGPVSVTTTTADVIGEERLAILRESAGEGRRPTVLLYFDPDHPADVRLSRQSGGARALAAAYGLLALVAAGLSLLAFRLAAGLMLSPAGSRP